MKKGYFIFILLIIFKFYKKIFSNRFLLDLDIELESIKLVVLSRLEGLFKKNKSAIGHVEINFSDYLDVKLPITKWFELEMEQQQSSDE